MPPRRRDGSPAHEKRRTRLTDFVVRRTSPEASAFQIWDEDVKGLCVRIQPSGQRSFFAYYRRGGRRRMFHIGDVREVALGDARKIALQTRLRVIEGADPHADRQAGRNQSTVAELHQRYVDQYARRKKSWRQGAWLVKRYILPSLGNLQIGSVTQTDVQAAVDRIAAPILKNQVLASSSAVFGWAVKRRLISTNPCSGIERNPVTERRRILSDDELLKFWPALKREGTAQARAAMAAVLLGQRIGEICHMRREHVEPTGWWVMPGQRAPALGWNGTKNGDDNHVWLPQAVRQIIGDGATGFVFTNGNGGPVSKVDKLMRRICKEIGIERATPHDLRRTHQTLLARCGASLDLVDRIGNHRMKKIRRTYVQYDFRPQIQRAMDKTAAFIMDLVEGRRPDNVIPLVG